MSQQSICVYAALAINSFACSEPEGMEDTTPLLGMNYSHFGQKLAKKQAKTEEHNVESAKAIHRWRIDMRKCLPVAFLCLLGCERPPNPLAISQAFPVPSSRGSGWSSFSTSHRSRPSPPTLPAVTIKCVCMQACCVLLMACHVPREHLSLTMTSRDMCFPP